MSKRIVFFDRNGFVSGSAKTYEKGEPVEWGEILVPLITGAIALFGLYKLYMMFQDYI
jgi:hypothetical protein